MKSTAAAASLLLTTATADFCGEISAYLPSECTCTELQYGANLACTVNFFSEDTITIQGTLQLCKNPAEANIVISDTKFGIHHTLAGLTAGKAIDWPIPGLSLDIPDIGSVGVNAVFDIEGDLSNLDIKLGLDACGTVVGKSVCGSDLTDKLPIYVLDGSFDFDDLCKQRQQATTVSEIAQATTPKMPQATTPEIPKVFTAVITTNTSGTSKSIPQGVKTYKQYYDYSNKRLRKDATSGMTKVYRYDINVQTPIHPGPNDPEFASPRGYQFQTNNPDLNCCWLWLVDTSDGRPYTTDRMFQVQIPKGAKDIGASSRFGGTEHWAGSSAWPFKSTGDWYVKNNNQIVQYNSYVNIPTQGTIIENMTYTNYTTGPIDVSVFAHPNATSNRHPGKCGQFGVDPMCSNEDMEIMLAEHRMIKSSMMQMD